MSLKKGTIHIENLFLNLEILSPDPPNIEIRKITSKPKHTTGILTDFYHQSIESNINGNYRSPADTLLQLCREETKTVQVTIGLSEIYRQYLIYIQNHEPITNEHVLLEQIQNICQQKSLPFSQIENIAIFSIFFPDTIEKNPLSYAFNVANNLNNKQKLKLPEEKVLSPDQINIKLMETIVHRLNQSHLLDVKSSIRNPFNDTQVKYLAANTDTHYIQAIILHAIAQSGCNQNTKILLNIIKGYLDHSKANYNLIQSQINKLKKFSQFKNIEIK